MSIKNLYECADFFLARTSVLSLDDLEGYFCHNPDDFLNFAINNSVFSEAIAVASPNLYQAIHRLSHSSDKNAVELKKAYNGMLKYFLRMASRATPFGLFSFVWWGAFSDKTQLQFSLGDIKKNVKPDMEWIYSVINIFDKDYAFIRNFKIMTSPFVHEECGKYYLKKFNLLTNSEELTSIKLTEFTQKTFEITSKPIVYLELEKELLILFSAFEPEKITTCLWDIFQKGYFTHELYPALNKPFNIEIFLSHLNQYKNFITVPACQTALATLSDICRFLFDYQETPIGKGISQLLNLEKAKKISIKTEHLLQVDAYKKTNTAFLPHSLKTEIEEAASVLFLLSFKGDRLEYIADYYREFAEKYGLNRLVPIKDLLNPNLGLGIPHQKVVNERKVNEKVHEILSKQLADLKAEIVIDNILNECEVLSQEETNKAPLSIELFLEIFAPSQEEIDKGNCKILLNPVIASDQAGSTFGRFLYLWDQNKLNQLIDFLKKEERLLGDVVFIEASFQPLKARTTNVCFYEKLRDFQLRLFHRDLHDQTLEINDIFVGINDRGLYLYSKKLQKEIKVILSTAVNSEFAPPILKLMLDISKKDLNRFSPYIFEEFKNYPFLPSVRYKNVVLCPARWYFTFQNLRIDDKAKIEEVDRALRKAMESFSIPDQIFLVEFDNRLLLKRSNSNQFKMILDHFIAKKELTLFEQIKFKGYLPVVKSESGFHVSEFVIPLVKKKHHLSLKRLAVLPLKEKITQQQRKKIVGSSDWLYAKLFLPADFEKDFLVHYVNKFTNHLLNNSLIDKWFFVRYYEEKPHVRLRLHGDSEILNTKGLLAFSNWMGSLVENHLISEFSLHNYDREIERYGGLDLMDLADEMFCFDSYFCIQILELSEHNKINFELEFIAALVILSLLKIFYPNQQTMTDFLSTMENEMGLLKGYRSNLKNFSKFVNFIWFNRENIINLNEFSFLDEVINLLNFLSQQFYRFKIKLDDCLNNNNLWNQKDNILDSFIHMHCNRLLGVNIKLEKKARTIAYFTLKNKIIVSNSVII